MLHVRKRKIHLHRNLLHKTSDIPRHRPRRSTEMAFRDMQKVSCEPLAEPSQESKHDEKPSTQIRIAADANVDNFGGNDRPKDACKKSSNRTSKPTTPPKQPKTPPIKTFANSDVNDGIVKESGL